MEIEADLLSEAAVGLAVGAPAFVEGWGVAPLCARGWSGLNRRPQPAFRLGIEEQRVSVLLRLDELPEAWAGLGHGFRVRVRILKAEAVDVLAVPQGALFRQGTGWAVFVESGGRAAVRAVTLGLDGGAFSEATEGLAAGEAVRPAPERSDRRGRACYAPRRALTQALAGRGVEIAKRGQIDIEAQKRPFGRGKAAGQARGRRGPAECEADEKIGTGGFDHFRFDLQHRAGAEGFGAMCLKSLRGALSARAAGWTGSARHRGRKTSRVLSTVTGSKFIGGRPMKWAMNVLAGAL